MKNKTQISRLFGSIFCNFNEKNNNCTMMGLYKYFYVEFFRYKYTIPKIYLISK